MNLGTLSLKSFSCVTLFLLLTAAGAVANSVDVYWDSYDGFYTGSVTINQGDEVDVGNLDESETMDLTWTDPAGWYSDVPPGYYVPIIFNNAGTYYIYDQYNDYVMVTVNSTAPPPPLSVSITSPATGAVFSAPGAFTVTAVPAGGASPYAEVDFYVGTNHTGVAYSSPYTAAVNNLSVGSYTISAVVTDNSLTTATNTIQVTVVPLTVTNYIVPVVCENLYSDGNENGFDLNAGTSPQGTMEFAEFNASQCVSIQLELNPYGLPLYALQVNVYGFDGGNGALSASNINEGTLIGVMTLPSNLGYGQPATFDITSFVKSTKGPYFGIWLSASNGGDSFSSLQSNYGLPPELYAILPAPPPPPAIAMAGKNLVISWSTNNSFGATLQTSPTIGPGANWVPVNLTPALVNGHWAVTNPISGAGQQFFRLSTTN